MEIQSEIGNINYTLDYKQSLFAQSDPRIHLGLGKLNSNVNVKISWPDGRIVQFTNIAINHYYQINKSAGQISKIEYPVETSSGKIVDLSTNASQQDINRLLTFAFLVTDKQVLKTLWSKANAENKIQLLNQIAQSTYLSNQTWLFHALQESDERLGLAALGIFKQKEWDHSVVYLLPLFEHENTQVVCALADMFAFFLDEEEVVLERKGLAVAPIMKSLKTADNQKKICLLKALAASENKRAVLSVIDTLKQSNNPEVLSIAIATLGLIRDARAKDEIKSVLETTQSPQVISATLVALQRLDDQDIATIFNQTFMSKPSEAKLIRQLETINLLLTDSEGVVISRSLVISALNELKNFIDDFDASPCYLTLYLKQLAILMTGVSKR